MRGRSMPRHPDGNCYGDRRRQTFDRADAESQRRTVVQLELGSETHPVVVAIDIDRTVGVIGGMISIVGVDDMKMRWSGIMFMFVLMPMILCTAHPGE